MNMKGIVSNIVWILMILGTAVLELLWVIILQLLQLSQLSPYFEDVTVLEIDLNCQQSQCYFHKFSPG